MTLSAFADKTKPPQPAQLTKTLGRTDVHWQAILVGAAADYSPLDQSWNYSGASWGWALRLKQKKRTIMYLTPCRGHFIVGFALGEKAVRAASNSDLPKSLLADISAARKYAEGRAVRIEVRNKRDRDAVVKLAAIKMAH